MCAEQTLTETKIDRLISALETLATRLPVPAETAPQDAPAGIDTATAALRELMPSQLRPIEAPEALRLMRDTLALRTAGLVQVKRERDEEVTSLLATIARLTLPPGQLFAVLDDAQAFGGSHHYLIWRNKDGTHGGAPVYDASAW